MARNPDYELAFNIPDVGAQQLYRHLEEEIQNCLESLGSVATFDIVELGHRRLVLSIAVIEGGNEAACRKIFQHFKDRGLRPREIK